MALTVSDVHDLTQILALHPEWRAEMRRLVLTDDLLALPQIVQELGEAQRRTELRIGDLAEAQQELTEAQRRAQL